MTKIVKDTIPGTNLWIYQQQDYFKYGIDSILLSWFARTKKGSICVDICAGSGIIGIRQQQIYDTKTVTLVEIDETMAELSQKTIQENELEDTVSVVCENVRTSHEFFPRGRIDCVTVNPPYMKKDHGYQAGKAAMARHEVSLSLEDLFHFAAYVLKSGGMFYMVHRPQRLGEIFYYGEQYHLPPKELMPVCSREGDAPKFVLIQFKKDAKSDVLFHPPLVIYDGQNYREEILRIYEGAKR